MPRLDQTYQSTIAADLLALTYQHHAPGYRPPKVENRLRQWTGESPYFKNRPLRGPRGRGEELRLLTAPRTFRNVPKLTKITIHSMVPQAQENSAYLHVAGMITQAISNVRATAHKARHNVVGWGLREGKYVAVTSEMEREDASHFLAKLIDVVLPRIKEWKGVPGSSGDGAGNMTFGLTPQQVALFPEIEVNYDAYVVRPFVRLPSANRQQLSTQDDSGYAHHPPHRCDQQQRRPPIAPSRRHPILREIKRLNSCHMPVQTCNKCKTTVYNGNRVARAPCDKEIHLPTIFLVHAESSLFVVVIIRILFNSSSQQCPSTPFRLWCSPSRRA